MNDLQRILSEIQYRTNKTLDDIARELEYQRSYLNDQINKGKNDNIRQRLIKKYKKFLVDYFNKDESSLILHDDGDHQEVSVSTLISQQNKLIESLNRQSQTANEILRRVADNIEKKVSDLDANLSDALGRVDSIRVGMFSGRMVVLQSLARLENKPENSLIVEADNIVRSLMDEQIHEQNKTADKGKKSTTR